MRKPKQPAAIVPWSACVLGVDPGEACGVCLMSQGVFVDSEAGDGFDRTWLTSWIHRSVEYAAGQSLPLVLVMEKPPRFFAGASDDRGWRARSIHGVASVIAVRKQFQRVWSEHEQTVNKRQVSVVPVTWRSRVLGFCRGDGLAAAEFNMAKVFSQRYVQTRDEAAAICIARWGSFAGDVGAVLPKRRERRGAA